MPKRRIDGSELATKQPDDKTAAPSRRIERSVAVGHRQSACETADITSERRRDCTELFERKIAFSTLNTAHVTAVDVRAIREVLL